MSGNWTSAAAQVRALAKAVSTAFAASNLTEEEKAPGRIEITDLPWMAPPLITPQLLSGARLQDFFDAPMPVDEHRLHAFWVKTLDDMWQRPSSLLRRGIIANTSASVPQMRVGQRAFRFSHPMGCPSQIDDSAGVTFSLEVAHTAIISLPIRHVVSDDSNYFAELPGGGLIGVRDGRPLHSPFWDVSYENQVGDMLCTPRGDVSYLCEYDQLASLRSVLHVHRKSFPDNFEALDQALQALRLLSFGGHCPELLRAMRATPRDLAVAREQERALRDAIDAAESVMSDRSKLQTLRALLVPTVLPVSGFRRHIFSSDQYPFTLAHGKMDTITSWLKSHYQAQIPADLQRLHF